MYKTWKIVLRIEYPECRNRVVLFRKARTHKEAEWRAWQAADKIQGETEDGGRVSISYIEEVQDVTQ